MSGCSPAEKTSPGQLVSSKERVVSPSIEVAISHVHSHISPSARLTDNRLSDSCEQLGAMATFMVHMRTTQSVDVGPSIATGWVASNTYKRLSVTYGPGFQNSEEAKRFTCFGKALLVQDAVAAIPGATGNA